jgi:hypothetical protein
MRRLLTVALATVVGAAASAAVVAMRPQPGAPPQHPVWSEIEWPFPVDQWGTGKAFACTAADCGTKVEVYIRPKVGYCNCSTGVDSDAELERVGDTELLSQSVEPLGRGRPIKVGWMQGLARPYKISAGGTGVVSIAFNDECDAVVALAAVEKGDPAAVAPAVMAFLNTMPMVLWVKKELGLEFVRRDW